MPYICYTPKRFGADRLATIAIANQIIAEYTAAGYELTLRQLYYQFVARDYIRNQQSEYNKLGATLNEARLAGLIDWNSIVDRTRNLRGMPHKANPQAAIDYMARGYYIDKWATQRTRVEVWIEKDALVGVIESVCVQNDVNYFSCRGYTSQSEMWSAAQRFIDYANDGQNSHIIHLGDHDPSGKDMSRDIEERIQMFMAEDSVNHMFSFERIALNMDQIDQYNPPPNPAKLTDSRATAYIDEYGSESWELDALDPRVIGGLVQGAIENVRDDVEWSEAVDQEKAERAALRKVGKHWPAIEKYVETLR